jgi:hypothetical protein
LADLAYMNGRRKYGRPQALLLSNNPGYVYTETDSGSYYFGKNFYLPLGTEVGALAPDLGGNEFLILSDDNRSPIDFSFERIERRERMVNGRMRSYHIADKMKISTSWENLASRSFSRRDFDQGDTEEEVVLSDRLQYTSDAGAGAADLLDWYERYTGSFWAFIAYDKQATLRPENSDFDAFTRYGQVVEVMFSEFSATVASRGRATYDFWNVNLSLEEV